MTRSTDIDPGETREWLDALDAVVEHDGPQRARELLEAVYDAARFQDLQVHEDLSTPYVNTIPKAAEAKIPDSGGVARKLRSLVRWNAIATVMQANKESSELGGHIASYQSAATLYEVGFNHFWRGANETDPTRTRGDLIYIQGHSSPGIYARSFLEGRLSEEDLRGYRTEALGPGLSSYPHPWLMPDFWQFPTVSMGLGSLMAIYQARFMKYLSGRGVGKIGDRKVWAFLGDGEMDEPESLGAISLAGRERLDNLIFVVNCNLQRLDGPVRGNGKIIQELETVFRGAGWNVLKVIWGSNWDPLLEADKGGKLKRVMDETLDGEYQVFKSRDGAYVRKHFFGKDPEVAEMVKDWSDEEIFRLTRGGHDPHKVYAAYHEATHTIGKPTVILAKTIKGYGMGESGEGQNITHQAKTMNEPALLAFRDRFHLDISDEDVRDVAFHRPPDDSPELVYLRERREALGGSLPARITTAAPLPVPGLDTFRTQLDGSGDREVSTTMAFVRMLSTLLRDKELGPRIVPIVPDESRTFGMEGMFKQLGIFSQMGQLYVPQDEGQLMSYREDRSGQILQEGINEPGAFSSWIAAATSYANHGETMVPFYIYYSMFGFQRVGDLAWAAGDSRARGFLLGGTAGRTTLNGEGLQHEDGHSHLQATLIPNCVSYDPAYGYELAVILHSGLQRMIADQEDVFFYITLMNENYVMPPMPEGAEDAILRGLHQVAGSGGGDVRLIGAGTILREVLAGAELLASDWELTADVFSATSLTELRRDGMAVERWNRLHPTETPQVPYVTEALGAGDAPVIASTDYNRALADGIREWVPGSYTVLGTDGFGRSDYRKALRRFFEVDRYHVVVAALRSLGRTDDAAAAIAKYEIDAEAGAPWQR
jgi:pyruvate dehydrogenase E1 component